MTGDWVDRTVFEIYEQAGCDPRRGATGPELALRLMGNDCLRRFPSDRFSTRAFTTNTAGRTFIHVPSGLAGWRLNHRVSHAVGEWYLTKRGHPSTVVQALSRQLSAALCVPTPAFLLTRRGRGDDLSVLSQRFRVSESLMALRMAECDGCPTALRTPHKIIVRGDSWQWPQAAQDWEDLFRRAHVIGLVVRHLRDARGRLVVYAA